MKKVFSLTFFIAFTFFPFLSSLFAQNTLFNLSTEQDKRFNPAGSALMIVDDVAFAKSALGAATKMRVTKIEVGIRQEAAGSAATAVALYYTRFNGQVATGTPQLVGTQTASATTTSKTTILAFGDGENTLFEANLDDFGTDQAYKGFGIGMRIINSNTANGWRVASGPDANLNKFWLYGSNSWASNGAYYYFADGSRNSFYIKVYGNIINPLPVKLLDFSVKSNTAAGSELVWATATEQNTKNFEVQTTENPAREWRTIGTVSAAGNTNTEQKYAFLDEKSAKKLHYYRLKINDFDGYTEYSNVVACSNKQAQAALAPQVLPNIVRNSFNLHLPENYNEKGNLNLRIFNTNGQLISENMLPENSTVWQTNATDWASGAYFYELVNDYTGEVFSDKFVRQ